MSFKRRLRRMSRVFTSPVVAVDEAFHPSVARAFPGLPAPARRALFLSVSSAAAAIALVAWLKLLALLSATSSIMVATVGAPNVAT